jgi:Ca2+-binding RTX toxin-like protein
MTFDIRFDYRFDTSGFFTDTVRRDALEEAALIWESLIGDEFDDVAVGTTFSIVDPSDSSRRETITLDAPIDDLLIFVGAESLGGPLGRGGPTGYDAAGDIFAARVSSNFRDSGPITNFEPWAGVITFEPTATWNFDIAGPVDGMSDFISIALHEIGHVLGIGTQIFDVIGAGAIFDGPNALGVNGGIGIPLESDLNHVLEGFSGDTVLMDPTPSGGSRNLPSSIDLALLADMGYEIDGFIAQGSTSEITTEGDDSPVFGTSLADHIDGLDGHDQLIGAPGNDTLLGGGGNDTLFGEDGDDRLDGGSGDNAVQGGAGNDTLLGGNGDDLIYGNDGSDTFEITAGGGRVRLADFDLSDEVIHLVGSGFASIADALAAISRPFTNVSRLTFGDGTEIDVTHEESSTSPLTEAHFRLGAVVNHQALDGTSGNDLLSGDTGNDTLRGLTGNDTLRGGDGSDELNGGAGDDFIFGGETSADLRDVIYGGEGNDSIHGGYGNDELRGDAGNDSIEGGFGVDTVIGGDGDDVLTGSAWSDEIFGGNGNDFINGGFGHDRVNGGEGADKFYHLGIFDHGSDWIQDYNAVQGDVLMWGGAAATVDDFQINTADTANAGVDGVSESFVIYRPTGQIMWALVDGDAQSSINIQIAGQTFDLLA